MVPDRTPPQGGLMESAVAVPFPRTLHDDVWSASDPHECRGKLPRMRRRRGRARGNSVCSASSSDSGVEIAIRWPPATLAGGADRPPNDGSTRLVRGDSPGIPANPITVEAIDEGKLRGGVAHPATRSGWRRLAGPLRSSARWAGPHNLVNVDHDRPHCDPVRRDPAWDALISQCYSFVGN